ncbi:MAG: IPExxxVDY family protein [Chitinophagaceae bacterium]
MKLVLDIEDLTDDFFEGVRMFGVVSTYKNYKFVWEVNNALGLAFRCIPENEISIQKKNRQCYFPVYQHNVKNSTVSYYCYHNYFDGEALLPELKNIDFICLVKGGDSMSENEWKQLLANVKSVNCVQLVSEIRLEQIKKRENLVF